MSAEVIIEKFLCPNCQWTIDDKRIFKPEFVTLPCGCCSDYICPICGTCLNYEVKYKEGEDNEK
jgi:hypothetical protein